MKAVQDTQLLFVRHLKKTLRDPLWFFLEMLQPVLYLVLYMPLLRNIGNTSALPLGKIAEIFVPGMLVIMGISTLFSGFGFIPEIREGFMIRLLVTPVSRVSIFLSYLLERVARMMVHSIILLVIAFFLGLRVSFTGAVLTFVLVILIGATMTSFSYVISIQTRNEDALASIVNVIYLPIMLLSGIMLPISLAPQWLKDAAYFNPFYYAVEAARAMFLGNFSSINIIAGFVMMAGFTVFSAWLAIRSLQKMTA